MSNNSRHPGYHPPLDTQPHMMAYTMEPSPKSTRGTMDFLSRSTLELAFQPPTQSPVPFSPDFAPTGSAPPYSVNMMNQQSRHDSLVLQGRALSQAAYSSLGPPLMHRDTSIRSEPVVHYRQATPSASASAGRRIISDKFFAPLAQVQENPSPDVGVTPLAYFANTEQSYLSSIGTNLPLHDMFASRQSATPSMVTASTGTELGHPMTRENSFVLTSPRVDMTRMPSSASYADSLLAHAALDLQQLNCSNLSKMPEALIAVGGSFSNFTTVQYPDPEYQMLPSPTFAPTPMERVDSTSSVRSTASTLEIRAKQARVRVLQAQSASIAPMPQPLPQEPPRITHEKRITQPVTKAKQKPKPEKLQCLLCNEIPDGFRGPHELARHTNAKHSRVVKKYICQDARVAGVPTRLEPLNPLSQCKACATGKQYNAYYNAAAHLRRTHFRVKPSRGKGATAVGERRGGKGGGDWPPMAELKAWFVEIEVKVEGPASLVAGDDPPNEGSPSPASPSTAHMNIDVGSFGDVHTTDGDDDFDFNSVPVSYVAASAQEDSQFSLMSAFNDGDVDMFGLSQDSATPEFDSIHFDVTFLDNADMDYSAL